MALILLLYFTDIMLKIWNARYSYLKTQETSLNTLVCYGALRIPISSLISFFGINYFLCLRDGHGQRHYVFWLSVCGEWNIYLECLDGISLDLAKNVQGHCDLRKHILTRTQVSLCSLWQRSKVNIIMFCKNTSERFWPRVTSGWIDVCVLGLLVSKLACYLAS